MCIANIKRDVIICVITTNHVISLIIKTSCVGSIKGRHKLVGIYFSLIL